MNNKTLISILFIIAITYILIQKFIKYYHENMEIPEKSTTNYIYYINLDRDRDRKDFMENQFKKCQIKAIRFNAVDKKKIDLNILQNNGNIYLPRDSTDKKSFWGHNWSGPNKIEIKSLKGSIACALSHITIWYKYLRECRYLLSKNIKPRHAIIFEDDSIIFPYFNRRIRECLAEVPKDWDIIFLGGSRIYGEKISKHIIKAKFTNNWQNCGLFGYIINYKGSIKLVELTYPLKTYIDFQINEHYGNILNAYYVYPPIVYHNYDMVSVRKEFKSGEKFKYSKHFINAANEVRIVKNTEKTSFNPGEME